MILSQRKLASEDVNHKTYLLGRRRCRVAKARLSDSFVKRTWLRRGAHQVKDHFFGHCGVFQTILETTKITVCREYLPKLAAKFVLKANLVKAQLFSLPWLSIRVGGLN